MPASRKRSSIIAFDRRNRCINCSLLIRHFFRRYVLEQVSSPILNLLESWIAPTQLSSECVICVACFEVLQNRVNTMSEGSAVPLPALGHAAICFPCGKSILRACRTHYVQAHHREQNILSRWLLEHLVSRMERVCSACWRAAMRQLQRQPQQDSNRTILADAVQSGDSSIPEPPSLPRQQPQRPEQSKAPVVKLSSKRVSADQISEAEIKVPRKKERATIKVAEQFRTTAAGDVAVTSRALLGRKLCVLSDDPDCTKADLIAIVESHGGIHVQNIGENTWCSVAGKLTQKVKYIQGLQVNIISTSWLRNLPKSDTLCNLSPLDMLSISPETKLTLSLDYDRFGDSYTEFTDEATLKKCFDKMEMTEIPIYLTETEMLQVDEILSRVRISSKHIFSSFLRGCNICVENPLHALMAQMYGAVSTTSIENLSKNVTHVVISMDTKINKEEIKINTSAYVVSEEWLTECFFRRRMISEIKYLL